MSDMGYPALQQVLAHFEKLSEIPHGSGNTKAISDYCVQFAENHHLRWQQDDSNNVILWVPASAGYEQHDPVILQGHLDMVCAKAPDCTFDFTKDGLRLQSDGKYLWAEGTTLGGDDGIAIAVMLALAERDDLPHPPLEMVMTTDEETGMYGAKAVDLSGLNGRKLLNLDSEEEGVFTISCAGGCRAKTELPVKKEAATLPALRLRISGGCGGHSGVEIAKGRANTNREMARLLQRLEQYEIALAEIAGGKLDNAITVETEAVICTAQPEPVLAEVQAFAAQLQETYRETDAGLQVTAERIDSVKTVFCPEDSRRALALLRAMPQGVRCMSREIAGLPQTSSNFGIVETLDDRLCMSVSVRSSVNAEKESMLAEIEQAAGENGAVVIRSGEYPAWEYCRDSALRELCRETYLQMFGKEPEIVAIHAGLECGLLSAKLPGLDAVSMGPNILDIHSPRERLDLPSCERTWKFVLRLLEQM